MFKIISFKNIWAVVVQNYLKLIHLTDKREETRFRKKPKDFKMSQLDKHRDEIFTPASDMGLLPYDDVPDFTLESVVDGETETFTLSSLKGKYIILLFYPVDFGYVTWVF